MWILESSHSLTGVITTVEATQSLLQSVIELHDKADVWINDGFIELQNKLLLVIDPPAACPCREGV